MEKGKTSSFTLQRIGILSLFILFIFLFTCRQKEETLSSVNNETEMPAQESWQSKFIVSKAGRKQVIIRYGHMRQYEKTKIVYLDEGVEADFYDVDGQHVSNLVSETGEYNQTTEDVIGRGNVVVESDSGVTLFTQELRWDHHLEKIVSDTLVMLVTEEKDTLYGLGFESNADLSRRIIRKPWGISQQRINIERIEESFSHSAKSDSIVQIDSTETSGS